jgi:hypothetical protein
LLGQKKTKSKFAMQLLALVTEVHIYIER